MTKAKKIIYSSKMKKVNDIYILRGSLPGESCIFSGSVPEESEKQYKDLLASGITSIQKMFEKTVSKDPSSPVFIDIKPEGRKITTYGELHSQCVALAKGLGEGGYCPEVEVDGKKFAFIGDIMVDRPEFVLADFACSYLGAVSISLFEEPVDHLVSLVESIKFSTVLIDPFFAVKFIRFIESKTIRLINNFVLTEDLDPDIKSRAAKLGIKLVLISDLIEIGKKSTYKLPELAPETVVTIQVTSGSTGVPKGVMLTHRTMLFLHLVHWEKYFSEKDTMLVNQSYAFSSMKLAIMICIMLGGKAIFYGGVKEKMVEVMRETNPNLIVFPPVMLHKLYGLALQHINKMPSPQKEGLMKAIETKIMFMKAKKSYTHPELDKFLIPLRDQIFGKGMRLTFYNGAQVREDALWFFRALFCCPLCTLYGITEMGSFATVGNGFDVYDAIGRPLPGFQCKIVDWVEGGYTTKDKTEGKLTPRGELYIKCGSFFAGYLGLAEKTKECFSADGWFKTNDVVRLDLETMTISIVDRVNNVKKLSNGEFIAVELFEKLFETCSFLAQVYIHVAIDKDYIMAIAHPKKDIVLAWAKSKGLGEDFVLLCQNKELLKEIMGELQRIGEKKGLASYEFIGKIYLTPEPFTQANGMLTYSFKLRRNNISKVYEKELKAISSD